MKAKKMKVIIGITMLSMFISYSTVSAKVTRLWGISNNTYVTSEHGDNWAADTYHGVASVLGADRVRMADGHLGWYQWTKITYNVQGHIYSATARANSKDDRYVRKSEVTARDIWNFGSATRAYYNYQVYSIPGLLVP